MRRKVLAGFTSQTVTHSDKPETVLLECFSSFQGGTMMSNDDDGGVNDQENSRKASQHVATGQTTVAGQTASSIGAKSEDCR